MRITNEIKFGILQIEGKNGYKVTHIFTATPQTEDYLKSWLERFKNFHNHIHEIYTDEVVGGMFQEALEALYYHFAKHQEVYMMDPPPVEYLTDADMIPLYSDLFRHDRPKRSVEEGEKWFVDIFNNTRIFYDYIMAGPGCKVEVCIGSKNPGDGKDCILFSDYADSLEMKNRAIEEGEIELMEMEKTNWALYRPSRSEKAPTHSKAFIRTDENMEDIERGKQMLLGALDPKFRDGLE